MKNSKSKNGLFEDYVLTYGKYLQVAAYLQHSNYIQLRYKMITFTWLLATFIGTGYTLSNVEVNLPFQPFLIVSVLCMASLCVIGIIWYLDIIVQEKNIATAVHQGLYLEVKNPWLPRTYNSIVKMNYLSGYVSSKSVFYLGCTMILVLTISYSITSYLYLEKVWFWPVSIVIFLVTFPVIFFFQARVAKRSDPYAILRQLRKRKMK